MTGAHEAFLDYSDLFRVTLHGDDVQDFDTRWDEVLLSISQEPTDDILESLYNMRIRESDQLKTVIAMYCRQIHLTREFFSNIFTLCTHHIVAQGVFGAHSLHLHVIHDVTCLSVRC